MKNILLVLLLFVGQGTFAQIPQPEKNTYVNDFAHVLSTTQVADLNKQISVIEKNTGTQMAVILVDAVPDAYTIEDYALLIGRKWHVGTNKNGIVYVAAIGQRKQRLQIATGLYSTLTKDKRDAILDKVKPYFKQEDYAGGLKTLISQIGDTLGADFGKAPDPDASTSTTAGQNDQAVSAQNDDVDSNFWVGFVVFAVVLSLIIAYFVRRRARTRRMLIQSQMYNGGNFGPDGMPIYPNQPGSGVGSFVAGAAAGALAGYAADRLMNGGNNNNINQNNVPNNSTPVQNEPQDYGNWGGGSSFDDSSSSDDSGFSSDSSDSDSGSSSDW